MVFFFVLDWFFCFLFNFFNSAIYWTNLIDSFILVIFLLWGGLHLGYWNSESDVQIDGMSVHHRVPCTDIPTLPGQFSTINLHIFYVGYWEVGKNPQEHRRNMWNAAKTLHLKIKPWGSEATCCAAVPRKFNQIICGTLTLVLQSSMLLIFNPDRAL